MRNKKQLSWLMVLSAALVLVFPLAGQAKRYVISIKSKSTFDHIKTQHKSFRVRSLRGGQRDFFLMSSSAKVEKTLEHVQMVVVDSDKPESLRALQQNPEILAVEEEVFYEAPKPIISRTDRVAAVPAMLNKQGGLPWGVQAVNAPGAWAQGVDGTGARVLVLDTGLDKDHPDIRNNFEAGKNFVPAFAEPERSPVPYDFFDQLGHGTHVTGTILANGDAGLYGVAPQASILMGRVCSAGCSNIAIIEGVNWGIAEGVDVINLSLGGPFISRMEREAYLKAENAGIVVVAASGNDGVDRISFPAGVDTVVAVGAVDETGARADFSQYGPGLNVMAPGVEVESSVPQGSGAESLVKVDLGNGLEEVTSVGFVGSEANEIPLSGDMAYAGLGKPEDFLGADVRNKIALISRGEIRFSDKVINALKNGAKAVLIFNNEAGLIRGGLTDDGSSVGIPVIMIEQHIGEALVARLEAGEMLQAAMSTVRTNYAAFQGTSMASPHVAGVVALIRSVAPYLTPAEVRSALFLTSQRLGPANEYGHGLVNAEAAVAEAQAPSFFPVASGQ